MGEGRAPHDVEQNSLLEESQAGITGAASFKGNFLGESRKQGRGGPGGQLEALDEKRNSLELLFDKVSVNVGTMHRPIVLGAKKENDVEAADGGLWSKSSGCRADWAAFAPLFLLPARTTPQSCTWRSPEPSVKLNGSVCREVFPGHPN